MLHSQQEQEAQLMSTLQRPRQGSGLAAAQLQVATLPGLPAHLPAQRLQASSAPLHTASQQVLPTAHGCRQVMLRPGLLHQATAPMTWHGRLSVRWMHGCRRCS